MKDIKTCNKDSCGMFFNCFQDAFEMFGRGSKAEYFLNNFYCGGGYFLTFLRGFGIIQSGQQLGQLGQQKGC